MLGIRYGHQKKKKRRQDRVHLQCPCSVLRRAWHHYLHSTTVCFVFCTGRSTVRVIWDVSWSLRTPPNIDTNHTGDRQPTTKREASSTLHTSSVSVSQVPCSIPSYCVLCPVSCLWTTRHWRGPIALQPASRSSRFSSDKRIRRSKLKKAPLNRWIGANSSNTD